MLSLPPRAYCSLLSLCLISANIALASSVDPTLIDSLLTPYDRNDRPGVAVMVIEKGEVVYSKGFGMANLDHNIEITPQTVFQIGSVSKQFAAFSILLLDERGLLSLDDEIHSILPDLPDFGHPITVRQLMVHTSGLRDYFEPLLYAGWNLFTDIITPNHIMNIVSRQTKLNFPPDTRFLYSNTGYFLMGRIVEKITGMSLREFAHAEIFQPLGMSNTHFDDDDFESVRNRAESYAFFDERAYRIPLHFTSSGEAGVVSTLDDLAKWDANFESHTVGSASIFDKMVNDGVNMSLGNKETEPPRYYAGGLVNTMYKNTKQIFHTGALAGYRSIMLRFPERQISLYALSNDQEFDQNHIPFRIADLYLEESSTSVNDFLYHHSSSNWGSGAPIGLPNEDNSAYNRHIMKLMKDRAYPSTRVGLSSVTPSADELDRIAGRYYSAECDAYVDIGLDAQGGLALKMLRGYELVFSELGHAYFELEEGMYSGEFQETPEGIIDRFSLSGFRAFDLEFIRMESPSGY